MIDKKTILSLDLGTTTGYAVSTGSDKISTSGVASFKQGRYDGGGIRFLKMTKWLNETLRRLDTIDCIYFEEVRRHLGVDASHVYGGFLATLTSWCEEKKIPYQGISVGTIKKYITGKGNASKTDVINNIESRGYKPIDDNEADAIALLLYSTNK